MGEVDPRAEDPGYVVTKLQRFYHAADPLIWIDMSEDYRAMFSKAIPRLEAEESEQWIHNATAAASHRLSPADARQYMRGLYLTSSGRPRLPRGSIRPKSAAELARLIGEVPGFKMVIED